MAVNLGLMGAALKLNHDARDFRHPPFASTLRALTSGDLFRSYLATLQEVLNGEAFLLHFYFDEELDTPVAAFEELLRLGVIKSLLSDYYEATDPSQENQLLYREELLPDGLKPAVTSTIPSQEISAAQFRDVLQSTLDCTRRGFGHFTSFYGRQLPASTAVATVDRLVEAFQSLASNWRYYWVDTSTFDPLREAGDFYFWNLGNDSCVVWTDARSHLFVLLTNGTD